MGKYVNYKKIFAKQRQLEMILRVACPSIDNDSGIYFLTREDEKGKYAYIGKAVNLIRRMVSHLQGYQQRIDISLRKRGLYSDENESGWHLSVKHIPYNLLDEKERYYIEKAMESGYILYNIESGGSAGKTMIGERKPPKTYRDGLRQGEAKTKKIIKTYFDKYLTCTVTEPRSKFKEKKLNEFMEYLTGKKTSENDEENS